MVAIPKRNRTQSRFNKIELDQGTTLQVPFQFTLGSLKTVPVDGGFEYDGSRYYGTLNSTLRKTFAFTDELNAKQPEYFKSISKKNNDNVYGLNNPVGNKFNSTNLTKLTAFDATGTTSGKVFTRSSGTWTANSLIGLKAKLINGGSISYREILGNTTTELYFKRTVPTATTVEIFPDNIVDDSISLDGFTREIFFDGQNLWVCSFANQISKIDPVTMDKTDFTMPISPYSFGFDGINIWCIGDGSTPIRRFNTLTETFDILSINGTISTNGYCVFVGKYIYSFNGTNGYKYDVEALTKTTLAPSFSSNCIPIGVTCFPNSDFIYYSVVNSTGTTNFLYKYQISTDTIFTTLLNVSSSLNTPLRFTAYDGLNMFALNLTKVSKLTELSEYEQIATLSFTFLSNAVFDGQNLIGYGRDSGSVYGLGYINPTTLTLTNFLPMDKGINGAYNLIYTDQCLFLAVENVLHKIKSNNQNKARHTLIKSRNASQIGSFKQNTNLVNSTTYLSLNDSIIFVDTTAVRTLYLPDCTKCLGQTFMIKDNNGSSSTNNITINTILSQTIDGNSSYTINTNWLSLSVISNGTSWRII
jgi:hypothetical protein